MKFDRVINPSSLKLYCPDIKAVIDSCKGKVHILIEPERKARSCGAFSQNHHLNGHIQQICKETGNDFDDVKTYVKQMAISMGYPIKQKFGRDEIDLWGRPKGISEADADTKQCAMLIECVHRLASELDVILEETEIAI